MSKKNRHHFDDFDYDFSYEDDFGKSERRKEHEKRKNRQREIDEARRNKMLSETSESCNDEND